MKRLSPWFISAILSLSGTSLAQSQDSARELEGHRQARALFQAGLGHAQQGDLLTALAEFEAAYRAQPHFSVLYNIAQARSTLGRPVEANDAFKRYLVDGGSQVTPERREEVEGLISANQDRIGMLLLVAPTGQSVQAWLDGVELGAPQLAQPFAVARGEHTLVYGSETGPVRSQKITVTGAKITKITLDSAPVPPTSTALTQLAVACAVPDAVVAIDGVRQGTTPLKAPLLVAVGPHRLELSRPGYVPSHRNVQTQSGKLLETSCALHPLAPLPSVLAANLDVRATPARARVLLDGEAFLGGAIPAGAHRLRVESDGFLPEDRAIVSRAGERQALSIALAPTPAAQADRNRAGSSRRTTAFVLGGFAIASLGASGGVYAWNSARYERWGGATHATPQQAATIQRGDDAAIALAVTGVGLAAAATWLLVGP
jgi:hypothetical protein